MTTLDHTDLLPAERLLLQAAQAGEPCNLIDPDARPTHDEIAAWNDPNREIRADFLAQLLTNRDPRADVERIDLRGAIVLGILDVSGPIDIVAFDSTLCRYQDVIADGATFTGDTGFVRATFDGDARFVGARFARAARFDEARFARAARFVGARFAGAALFGGATFSSARFVGARFAGAALFGEATFTGDALFDGATFTGAARFGGARFRKAARFVGARFAGAALFGGARFAGAALFGGATFSSALFVRATFTEAARFDEATFTRDLFLNQVVAQDLTFLRTTFNGPVDGAWAAETVAFDEARFVEPVTIRLLCLNISLTNVELRSRGTFQLRGGVDATAATFGGRTTLADPGTGDWQEWLPGHHMWWIGREQFRHESRNALVKQLLPLLEPEFRTTVSSLRRANVADLELSAVDLTDCRFDGAHGLDKMRIDSACTLPSTPEGVRFRRPVKFTGREVIAEERAWRKRFASWEPEEGPVSPGPVIDEHDRHDTNENLPGTSTIAGIYRALRKGREDSSDAPGAADFYYGEMEMRRLARREWRKRYNDSVDRPRKPSLAEHWLLTAYWAVSGYGLRAWRALAAIIVLILVGATVFATVGVDRSIGVTERVSWVHPFSGAVAYEEVSVEPKAFTWWNGLELAGRSSVALLRSTTGVPALTGIGTVTDIALRLLVPVLIALAALAIRGRTKR